MFVGVEVAFLFGCFGGFGAHFGGHGVDSLEFFCFFFGLEVSIKVNLCAEGDSGEFGELLVKSLYFSQFLVFEFLDEFLEQTGLKLKGLNLIEINLLKLD